MNGPAAGQIEPRSASRVDGKAWANLQARAALAGFCLTRRRGPGGDELILERNGQTRVLRSIDDVEDLVVAIGETAHLRGLATLIAAPADAVRLRAPHRPKVTAATGHIRRLRKSR